jgi:hypothetical protein
VDSNRPRPLSPLEKPVTYCTGRWVGPRAGMDRCGRSGPTGIRSPDRPARRVSLYRLIYPTHLMWLWLRQTTTAPLYPHRLARFAAKQLKPYLKRLTVSAAALSETECVSSCSAQSPCWPAMGKITAAEVRLIV